MRAPKTAPQRDRWGQVAARRVWFPLRLSLRAIGLLGALGARFIAWFEDIDDQWVGPTGRGAFPGASPLEPCRTSTALRVSTIDRHASARLAVAAATLALVGSACGSPVGGSVTTPGTSVGTGRPVASVPVIASPSPVASAAATSSPMALGAMDPEWSATGLARPDLCCQLWWPAINPATGQVWVANSFDDEYWIFGPNGSFKEAWGTSGTGPAQFDFDAHRSNPQAVGAIAFAPDGSFFVADNGNHRIQHFDAQRNLIGWWGSYGMDDGQFAEPFGITTDGTTVFVADDDRGDVQAFSTDGTYLRTFGRIINYAGIFIAADTHGNVYRSGGAPMSVVSKYRPRGDLVADFDLEPYGELALGVAVDAAGNVYANVIGGATPVVLKFDPAGKRLAAWSGGGETLAVNPAGSAVYEAFNSPPLQLVKYALGSRIVLARN